MNAFLAIILFVFLAGCSSSTYDPDCYYDAREAEKLKEEHQSLIAEVAKNYENQNSFDVSMYHYCENMSYKFDFAPLCDYSSKEKGRELIILNDASSSQWYTFFLYLLTTLIIMLVPLIGYFFLFLVYGLYEEILLSIRDKNGHTKLLDEIDAMKESIEHYENINFKIQEAEKNLNRIINNGEEKKNAIAHRISLLEAKKNSINNDIIEVQEEFLQKTEELDLLNQSIEEAKEEQKKFERVKDVFFG